MATESRGPADGDAASLGGESRWPMTVVLVIYVAITVVLALAVPESEILGPRWLVPALEIALLAALIAADPTQLHRRSKWLRPLAITLIVALTVLAIVADVELIVDLIEGNEVTNSATSLLASGALIWLGTALVFGLLYWELDSGGPLARYQRRREFPDFAFTQQINPDLAPPGWRPRYVDYLALGFTTSTAFSPTDVMPMAPWAKLTMALQSLISLTVIGLVIARAVNVFT
jgi:uncharacterized membrane protein